MVVSPEIAEFRDPWDSRNTAELPRDKKTKVLETGDWSVTLDTPSQSLEFLIGVDPDGSPTAASGTVRRAD